MPRCECFARSFSTCRSSAATSARWLSHEIDRPLSVALSSHPIPRLLKFVHPVRIFSTQVVKPMDKKKVLVKVHPEGKFVVDVDKNIDINDVTPNCRY